MSEHIGSIVVGVDASAGSDTAIRWGVEEARIRKLPLHLVHAQATRFTTVPWAASAPIPQEFWESVDKLAQDVLDESVRLARAVGEDLTITSEVIHEHPAVVLPSVSEKAAMLVMGSRRLGTAGSFFLGSVSGSVAAHAHCPIIVTRGEDIRSREHRPVVIGIAPTALDEAVIGFAFNEASVRRAPLHAVLMWHERIGSTEWLLESQFHQGHEAAVLWLSEALAGWREKFPDVDVTPLTVEDHPAPGLVRQAADAQLLVVGRHATGAVRGTLLGSVNQAVLHHATCPVAVVPAQS